MQNTVRIDKFLWSVRVFKTRSLASDACRSGKIKVNGQVAKPSREVNVEDVITINLGVFKKTLKIIAILKNRVGAKLVNDYVEDQTPAEEYDKLKMQREMHVEYRDKGIGRPTKKQRRIIDKLKNHKHFSSEE